MKTEATPERIAKLPKWAQEEIIHLRLDNTSLCAKLAQIDSGESPITWDEFNVHDDGRHAIPPGANVRFQLQSGEIVLRIEEGYLKAQAVRFAGSGTGSILVQPEVSNSIRLRVGDYWREGRE